MKTYENPRKSTKIYENPRKSQKINENQSKICRTSVRRKSIDRSIKMSIDLSKQPKIENFVKFDSLYESLSKLEIPIIPIIPLRDLRWAFARPSIQTEYTIGGRATESLWRGYAPMHRGSNGGVPPPIKSTAFFGGYRSPHLHVPQTRGAVRTEPTLPSCETAAK